MKGAKGEVTRQMFSQLERKLGHRLLHLISKWVSENQQQRRHYAW